MKAPSDPKGYTDPGTPESERSRKRKQLDDAGLLNNGELMNGEDALDGRGYSRGGFLKRNNFGDRF